MRSSAKVSVLVGCFVVAAVACVFVLAAKWPLFGYVTGLGKVEVRIRNVEANKPLNGVVVSVTGATYPLGDIEPGETRSVRVKPAGESRVTIQQVRSDGTVLVLNVDCYIEPGYSGRVEADVNRDALVQVKNDIRF